MIRTLFISLLVCGIAACSSTPTYNASVFPYEIDQEELAKTELKRLVIASINLGGPSRRYLQEMAPSIDKAVADYLEDNGYKVLPQRRFEQQWIGACSWLPQRWGWCGPSQKRGDRRGRDP